MWEMATIDSTPVLLKQQARIDRTKIELQTGNSRLVIMRQQVEDLEKKMQQAAQLRATAEIEKQLQKEINHLTFQCKRLAVMLDKATSQGEFYNSIYTGPTGPLLGAQHPRSTATRPAQSNHRQTRSRYLDTINFQELERPKWNCTVCTFLNHPDLDKCEECEMPRVYHGRRVTDLTLDALKRLPNPADLGMSFGMFQQSSNALRKSVSSDPHITNHSPLTTSEMLRRLKLPNNINQAINITNIVPLSSSASAPNVIQLPMNTNSSDA